LLEELLHALLVLGNIWVDFAVGAFQPCIGDYSRTAVSRARHKNDIEVLLFDDPVKVHVSEVESRRRPPVAEQARFDVLALERPFQKGIVEEINLANGEIVGCAPIGINLAEQIQREPSG
jgi:hypothetical protein